MSKKKLVIMNLAVMIGLGSSFAIPSVNAETSTEVQKEIKDHTQDVQEVQAELENLKKQSERVDAAIKDNEAKIKQTEEQIQTSQDEINAMDSEIAKLEEAIKERTEILKQRAISYQHSGGNVEYIDVLLGSTSFGDFLNRALAVGKIVEADRSMISQQEADEKELNEKKVAKVEVLSDLENLRADLEGMQADILAQKQQNDQLRKELQDEKTAKEAAINSLKQKAAALAAAEEAAKAAATTTNSSNSVTTAKGTSNNTVTFEDTPVNPNGTVNDLISAGYKYIGNSVYVFGGGRNSYDIANGRFDCSGFVSWAFSTVGVRVGASTEILKNTGTRVPTSSMQPGDMVFFDTYKKDGHVGIYVGGGKFIGSQSSTGVAIANMSSGYWAQKFNGRVMRVNL
ncbi:NlpC/P60 family protein [Metabacillus litoralis]|uniref:coiled-coil domain-containing protein n=1 Tax=Metabacillus TaxID=2675233 RepID=UPI000EF61B03|nr:C40 family peptidase [Metabacillus litoralis]MCM3161276.1 NlpC/P60 family protein [Metabacillus litoralis]MCM3412149.1 NlpC/P60 family protein [Metabacillus litoralis]UHA61850.1 NlpC/P60 family protein [Metabacillus litoralis]